MLEMWATRRAVGLWPETGAAGEEKGRRWRVGESERLREGSLAQLAGGAASRGLAAGARRVGAGAQAAAAGKGASARSSRPWLLAAAGRYSRLSHLSLSPAEGPGRLAAVANVRRGTRKEAWDRSGADEDRDHASSASQRRTGVATSPRGRHAGVSARTAKEARADGAGRQRMSRSLVDDAQGATTDSRNGREQLERRDGGAVLGMNGSTVGRRGEGGSVFARASKSLKEAGDTHGRPRP